jgi:hypothetical protein
VMSPNSIRPKSGETPFRLTIIDSRRGERLARILRYGRHPRLYSFGQLAKRRDRASGGERLASDWRQSTDNVPLTYRLQHSIGGRKELRDRPSSVASRV